MGPTTQNAFGAALILVANVGLVVGSGLLVARRTGGDARSLVESLFIVSLTAVGEITVVCTVLGIVNLLTFPAVLIAEIVVLTGLVRVLPQPSSQSMIRPSASWWALLATAALLAVVAVVSLSSRSLDPDTFVYHLVNAGTWLQTHSIWVLPYDPPGGWNSTAPGNGDLISLWLMLPTHCDQLACLTPIILGWISAISIVTLSNDLGATRGRSVAIALATLLTPAVLLTQSHSALTDLASCAGILAGTVFANRGSSHPSKGLWLVAGACFGFAAGSKFAAVLPSLIAVGVAVTFIPKRRHWTAAILVVAGYVALAAIWYIRNAALAGNPIFPAIVNIGPVMLRGAHIPAGASIFNELSAGHWSVGWADIKDFGYLIGPMCIVAAFAFAHAGTKTKLGRIAWVSVLMFLAYIVTPFTAGGGTGHADEMASSLRYMFPSLFLAASIFAATANTVRFRVVTALCFIYGVTLFALKASQFRGDLAFTNQGLLVALATTGVLAAASICVTRLWTTLCKYRLQLGAAGSLAAIAFATMVYSVVPAQTADGLIQSRGDKVALIGPTDIRGLMGAQFQTAILSVGAGPQGAQTPIDDPKMLTTALNVLDARLLGVGAAPSGWQLGNEWQRIGDDAGTTVYERR